MDRGGGCSQNSRKSKVRNLKLGKKIKLNGHGLSNNSRIVCNDHGFDLIAATTSASFLVLRSAVFAHVPVEINNVNPCSPDDTHHCIPVMWTTTVCHQPTNHNALRNELIVRGCGGWSQSERKDKLKTRDFTTSLPYQVR